MGNDMRFGLLLGVGLVIAAAVVYYDDEPKPSTKSQPVVPPSMVVVPAQEPERPLARVRESGRSSI